MLRKSMDKLWHAGLLFKLKSQLPIPYYQVILSYLTNRYFTVKYKEEITSIYPIQSAILQYSGMGFIKFSLLTYLIHQIPSLMGVTAKSEVPRYASENFQIALDNIQAWLKKWRLKVNEAKFYHIMFTLPLTQIDCANSLEYPNLTG